MEDWRERNAFGLWLGINGTATTGHRATRRLINTALVTIQERENTDGLAWTERGQKHYGGGLTGVVAFGDRQTYSFASHTQN